jgi:hypothetical protein
VRWPASEYIHQAIHTETARCAFPSKKQEKDNDKTRQKNNKTAHENSDQDKDEEDTPNRWRFDGAIVPMRMDFVATARC